MPKQQITVTVESSAYDLGKQLGAIVQAIVAKKTWTDILGQEIAQLGNLSADIASVGTDLADNNVDFYEGIVLGLKDGYLPPATVAAPTT